MTRYRVRITKVLEDGTELELANVVDHPWELRLPLSDWIARFRRMPRPPVEPLAGQMALGEAA